jgi:hypothetical protein
MAAPTNAAHVKKVLANSEPSTHGPFIGDLLRFGIGIKSSGEDGFSWVTF